MNKMVGPSGAGSADQWNSNAQVNNQPKEMQMQQSKPTGWEEPSPPSQRRNIPSMFVFFFKSYSTVFLFYRSKCIFTIFILFFSN